MKTKRAKRPACKPVKAWAVVNAADPKIACGWLFKTRLVAMSCAPIGRDCVVRVEIREIRRTKR